MKGNLFFLPNQTTPSIPWVNIIMQSLLFTCITFIFETGNVLYLTKGDFRLVWQGGTFLADRLLSFLK